MLGEHYATSRHTWCMTRGALPSARSRRGRPIGVLRWWALRSARKIRENPDWTAHSGAAGPHLRRLEPNTQRGAITVWRRVRTDPPNPAQTPYAEAAGTARADRSGSLKPRETWGSIPSGCRSPSTMGPHHAAGGALPVAPATGSPAPSVPRTTWPPVCCHRWWTAVSSSGPSRSPSASWRSVAG